MTTYLDMLPDELYQMIYSQMKQSCVQQAAAIGARRNRFTHVPNRRTNDSVIYHWLRDKPEKANSLWTDGESIYSYQYEIGHTAKLLNGRKMLCNHTAKGIGFVSQTTSQHVNRVARYADEIINE